MGYWSQGRDPDSQADLSPNHLSPSEPPQAFPLLYNNTSTDTHTAVNRRVCTCVCVSICVVCVLYTRCIYFWFLSARFNVLWQQSVFIMFSKEHINFLSFRL